MNSMRRIVTLTLRHTKEILREPINLVFLFGLPLAMEVLFYLLFASKTSQFHMVYLAPAMVGFANAFIALFLGILLSLDRASAFMVRLYTTRVRPYEYILSYLMAVMPLGLLQSALQLLVGGIADASFWNVAMLGTLAVSLATTLFFATCGLLLGTVCNEKAVGGVSSIVIMGQSVLSGMWFPVDGMSEGFNTFLNVLPFKNAAMALQNVYLDPTFAGVGRPILILLAYATVIAVISILLFRRKMRE